MYKIFTWSDNQSVQKALAYLYDAGRSTESQRLPSYDFRSVDLFKLHAAVSSYLKANALGALDLRLAMKLDLIGGSKDYSQLAAFTSKNIVGEAQVVATTIEGDNVRSLAKQFSSAISKVPASSLTKILPYGADKAKHVTLPSSTTMAAQDLKHFMSVTRNKVFPKKEGHLLYIDGVYENSSGGVTSLTALGMTFSGYVDGNVEETTGSGQLVYGGSVKSEIAIVAFFEGEYTAGANKLAFPEEMNWYDLVKGAKTGGIKMCSMGDKVRFKSIKGLSAISGNPTMIEMHSDSPHDPGSTMGRNFATYNTASSYLGDELDIDVTCSPSIVASVLGSVTSKGAKLGIPCDGAELMFFADDRTQACIVVKNNAATKAPIKTIAIADIEDDEEAEQAVVSKVAPAPELSDEEVLATPVIEECVLEGTSYSLYIAKKLFAVMPREVIEGLPVKRFQPISRNAPDVTPLIDKVMEVLHKGKGRPMSRHDIMEFMPDATNVDSIGSALSSLYRRGLVDKPKKGYYTTILV